MFRHLSRHRSFISQQQKRVAQRFYSSSNKPQGNTPSVPAMLAVASMGFAAYYTLVKSREGRSKTETGIVFNEM